MEVMITCCQRVYLNDGAANFTKKEGAFQGLFQTFSSIAAYDFNGDGFVDLFGWKSPCHGSMRQPRHVLTYCKMMEPGKFTDVTDQYAKGLSEIGMVTKAVWFDIDKDGDKDLLLCCEWGGIEAFDK